MDGSTWTGIRTEPEETLYFTLEPEAPLEINELDIKETRDVWNEEEQRKYADDYFVLRTGPGTTEEDCRGDKGMQVNKEGPMYAGIPVDSEMKIYIDVEYLKTLYIVVSLLPAQYCVTLIFFEHLD